MRLTIASGKGGTGKTTLAVSLASFLAREKIPVYLYDCDVEEPNDNLFLQIPIDETEEVFTEIPKVDMDRCTGCGECGDICEFSAIVLVKDKPLVFPELCHSCGGCMLVCPEQAIEEVDRPIGIIEEGERNPIHYTGGKLNISEAMSSPLIKEVKKYSVGSRVNIIDAPPGTSCPVISAVDNSDFVLLVTEPTPFGLNDLKLAVGMIRQRGYPMGVVINRSDIGDDRVEKYCEEENIDILGKIPESRDVAVAYSRGEVIDMMVDTYRDELETIAKKIGIFGQDHARSELS